MTKNIQVIDRADNCAYDVFAVSDEQFNVLFPNGSNVSFAEEVIPNYRNNFDVNGIGEIWVNPLRKEDVVGIHGTLFFEMIDLKAPFYPTRHERDLDVSGRAKPLYDNAVKV